MRCASLISLILFVSLSLAAVPATQAQTFVPVDPTATYLHTNQDSAGNSVPVPLSSLVFNGHALQPGDTINLAETGDCLHYASAPTFSTGMIGVFSSSNVLLDASVLRRVPGAIGEGDSYMTYPTYLGSQPTDIPEDFYVNPGAGTTVTIPPSARYLFLSADDIFFSDNSNPHNNFGAKISFVASGVTYYVSTLGNDANSGLDPAHPKRDIQNALNASAAGDQILVVAGTYYEHLFLSAGKQMFGGYSNDFTSRSSDPSQTIIDGSGSGNVVTHGGAVTTPHRLIDGFTIQHGDVGLYLPGSDITVSHDHITANNQEGINFYQVAPQVTLQFYDNVIDNNTGPGIAGSSGVLSIMNNIIRGNVYNSTAASGGAGIGIGGCTSTIFNNTISNNTAKAPGGGIVISGGTVTLSYNVITGNSTAGNGPANCYGGGIATGDVLSVTFDHNTVTGNSCEGQGAGVAIGAKGSVSITNCTISSNSGGQGGGLFINAPNATVSGNTIADNTASGQGGANIQFGSATIDHNTISGNQGGQEGGLTLYQETAMVTFNTITGNSAGSSGGGIEAEISSGTIADNLVSGNTASAFGGGIRTFNSPLNILNNKIIGNSAEKNSGGIEWDNSSGTIANNLIAHNKTAQYGGGISIADTPAPVLVNNTLCNNSATLGIGGINVYLSSPEIANNIVAFNQNGGIETGGSILSHNCVYGNTVYNYSGINSGPGDISLDPLFVNSAAGDYHLSNISPCIDAGDNSVVDPTWTDLDGLPRIHNGLVDIGAYEFQGVSADVTNSVQVTRGPLVYNPKAKTYTQTLTLKNVGASALAGPLQAVLTGLSSAVTLSNATGMYAGSEPYLTATAGALAPGAAVSVKAVFQNPANGRFTYKINVYSASF